MTTAKVTQLQRSVNAHFKEIPLIFIGPGTGLAPFRSIIQERVIHNTASAYTLHLFFGCRYKNKDFHCKEELEKMVEEQKLTLYCAFSRDQEDKIYVQHKIKEHKNKIYSLIKDQNAITYISGNAKNMPDNVREALAEVLSEEEKIEMEEAKERVREMERENRLQVETW